MSLDTAPAAPGRGTAAPAGVDVLRIEGLDISFPIFGGAVEAVRQASFRVLPGKVTALVGESGSGKSVIASAAMGLLPERVNLSGRILFTDPKTPQSPVDILTLPQDGRALRALRGSRIAKIFQEPMTSLSPLHTIGNQISEVLAIHEPKTGKEERRARSVEMLRLVGFRDPDHAFDMYPFEMSGGMRQRAMIAMALICKPALLIADEPTTALDVTIQAQILGLLRELQTELGMGMLLITHDLGVVANVADEVVVIYHGRIMEAGPVGPIFRNPQHAYLKGLMAALPHFEMAPGERLKSLREIPAAAGRLGLGPGSGSGAVAVPVAGAARASAARPSKGGAGAGHDGTLLRVRDVSVSFQSKARRGPAGAREKVRAVDGVSFDIRRGECLGLVGESGSGKTTLSKLLMRAVTPEQGSVILESSGQGDATGTIDVLRAQRSELTALRSRMQMIFQDPVSSLSPRMTVRNILAEPLEIHRRGTRRQRDEAVERLMSAVGLDRSFLNRYPHSMSGGQRQRVGIARALALGPELIVCDEPVSALDVSVQAQILNLLKDMQKELGLTYLFISHNLAVVNYMADRIAVMCAGRIVEMAPREVLMNRPVHPYTRDLLAAVPFPDLDRKLDFPHLAQGRVSSGRGWPEAFRDAEAGGGAPLARVGLGADHWVLARPDLPLPDPRPSDPRPTGVAG
ncbi:dipeptide ABC transporter ATP-binding protein [Acidimangrovimonas sediminis]|uniref:dipeptide ABC transporter ATP-binding protein n=1 Tax=Acidimangrovimonas sediminis TaxID=2056283 RepID=UPI000C7FC3C0|nr:ABC transporter ATP-binding protein [Acidimangrovimonas sediminis]